MPIIKSAIKQLRKSIKNRKQNIERKEETKKVLKTFEKLVTEKKTDDAKNKMKEAYSKIDRLTKKNIIHKNTAARRKAKVASTLNKALKTK